MKLHPVRQRLKNHVRWMIPLHIVLPLEFHPAKNGSSVSMRKTAKFNFKWNYAVNIENAFTRNSFRWEWILVILATHLSTTWNGAKKNAAVADGTASPWFCWLFSGNIFLMWGFGIARSISLCSWLICIRPA